MRRLQRIEREMDRLRANLERLEAEYISRFPKKPQGPFEKAIMALWKDYAEYNNIPIGDIMDGLSLETSPTIDIEIKRG